MNIEQTRTMFKTVKTYLEMYRSTGQEHYLDKTIECLKRLRQARLERMKHADYTVLHERSLWNKH